MPHSLDWYPGIHYYYYYFFVLLLFWKLSMYTRHSHEDRADHLYGVIVIAFTTSDGTDTTLAQWENLQRAAFQINKARRQNKFVRLRSLFSSAATLWRTEGHRFAACSLVLEGCAKNERATAARIFFSVRQRHKTKRAGADLCNWRPALVTIFNAARSRIS